MKRNQLPTRRRQANYVIPKWKLVYVSGPKAACTTIKWMLADALEIDPRLFYQSLSGETSRATTIHQERKKWLDVAPRLRDLTDEELEEITPESGWFVFTMTRHPSTRLWSGWQSKLLLREPRFMRQFAAAQWLPREPESTEQVLEDWTRFVAAVAAQPQLPIMQDIHFAPQTPLLGIGRTPYDRIYDTSEFATMVDDVQAHLERHGFEGRLTPRRSNETPLPALEAAFPPPIVAALAQTFAEDFATLDYDDPRPSDLRAGGYDADLLAAAAIIAERADRLGYLARRARTLDRKLTELSQGLAAGGGDRLDRIRGGHRK